MTSGGKSNFEVTYYLSSSPDAILSLLKRDGKCFSKPASSPASVLKLEEIPALVEGEVALQSGSKWEATDDSVPLDAVSEVN